MKKLLVSLSLCLLVSPNLAFGAWAVVNQVCANTTDDLGNDLVSSPIDTSGASLIVIYASDYVADGIITDSRKSTWGGLTDVVLGNKRAKMWYTYGSVGGVGHTFTFSGGDGFLNAAFCVLALSGSLSTDPFDQQSTNNTAETASTQPGSITPAHNDEIIISGISTPAQAGAVSIDSGFTIADQAYGAGFNNVAIAYLVQGTAGAISPTWTTDPDGAHIAAIASFQIAAAGAAPVRHRVVVLQ